MYIYIYVQHVLRQISWQALTDLEVANASVLSSSIASGPATRYSNLQQSLKNRTAIILSVGIHCSSFL